MLTLTLFRFLVFLVTHPSFTYHSCVDSPTTTGTLQSASESIFYPMQARLIGSILDKHEYIHLTTTALAGTLLFWNFHFRNLALTN